MKSNISYAVNKCSRYSINFNFDHDITIKRIIRYLAETVDLKIKYESVNDFKESKKKKVESDLIEYIDSAFDDCLNIRHFTSTYIFLL